ncbi:B-cell receptor CD22-like isoform X2 [Gigantopelta aegis]|uniref:B-cell receptor CD22-like isoform X2 n=1 Tax=Gigantopelta aegis TaxID=1735272 RepID=UPI001B88DABC|nr:B-cell receptor CD22-like isoform X2 [Gigantopelta aegis]
MCSFTAAKFICTIVLVSAWLCAESCEETLMPDIERITFVEGEASSISCFISNGTATSLTMSLLQPNLTSEELLEVSESGFTEAEPDCWQYYIKYSFVPNRRMNTVPQSQFSCSVRNRKGFFSKLDIIVEVRPFGPNVTIPDALEAGMSINTTCSVTDGSGPFSLTWYLESTKMNSSAKTKMNADGTRGIENTLELDLTPEHSGKVLKCELVHGRNYQRHVSKRLTVKFSPIVTVPTSNYSIKEGSTASLECYVRAEPISVVWWTKDNANISVVELTKDNVIIEEGGSDRYSIGNSSHASLTIRNVMTDDSGMYVCSASNDKGTATSQNITVDVIYPPKPDNVTSLITATVGDAVTLTCSVTANPAVTMVTWKYGNTLLPETGTTLNVNISNSSFGVYTCIATNPIGSSLLIEFTLRETEADANSVTPKTITDTDWTKQFGFDIKLVLAAVAPVSFFSICVFAVCLVKRVKSVKDGCQSKQPEQDTSAHQQPVNYSEKPPEPLSSEEAQTVIPLKSQKTQPLLSEESETFTIRTCSKRSCDFTSSGESQTFTIVNSERSFLPLSSDESQELVSEKK